MQGASKEMVLGLPEELWRGEAVRPPRGSRKVVNQMVRLNIPLDPAKTGRDAVSLESNLRRMIVGQDEAIQQIVNIDIPHPRDISSARYLELRDGIFQQIGLAHKI